MIVFGPKRFGRGDFSLYVTRAEATCGLQVGIGEAVVTFGDGGASRKPRPTRQQALNLDHRFRNGCSLEAIRHASGMRSAGSGAILRTEYRVARVVHEVFEFH